MLYEIRREVKVEPMSRLDYNILRDWTLPAYENGSNEGVKVTDISSGHGFHTKNGILWTKNNY